MNPQIFVAYAISVLIATAIGNAWRDKNGTYSHCQVDQEIFLLKCTMWPVVVLYLLIYNMFTWLINKFG